MDALALRSKPGQSVTTGLLSLLSKTEGISCTADILLLHKLDFLFGSADVLFLLLLCRQLTVTVGAIAAWACTIRTRSGLSITPRL